MTQDETQETRESPALDPDADEVRFSRADVESVGDPAAAGTGTATGDSPAAAQERADRDAEPGGPLERPEVQILGAFVGAFVLAKLLKRLFGRD
jgi:hypothetical protein